jgi:NACHT domain
VTAKIIDLGLAKAVNEAGSHMAGHHLPECHP